MKQIAALVCSAAIALSGITSAFPVQPAAALTAFAGDDDDAWITAEAQEKAADLADDMKSDRPELSRCSTGRSVEAEAVPAVTTVTTTEKAAATTTKATAGTAPATAVTTTYVTFSVPDGTMTTSDVSGYDPEETTTTAPAPLPASGESFKFDAASGKLTLFGNVILDEVRMFKSREEVKSVVCEKGTVFPERCYSMFSNNLAESIDLSNADTSNVTDMSNMFRGCVYLTSLTLGSFQTANVTSMNRMFGECQMLEAIDLSSFNTEKVENMTRMFNQCYVLKNLDLSSFKTPKLEKMSGMFANCQKLQKLDMSTFTTSNVDDIGFMFYNCNELTELNVTSFNTSKVTTIQQTFCHCDKLTSLDVSNFDTTNVENMQTMFSNCYGLTVLDLRNFNTPNLKEIDSMFNFCKALKTIYVSDNWTNANVDPAATLFSGDTALVGGNGTKYEYSHSNAEYARIDKADAPGYFTFASGEEHIAPIATTAPIETAGPVSTTTTKVVPATTTAVTTTGVNPATTTKNDPVTDPPETTTKAAATTTVDITTMTSAASATAMTTTAATGKQEPWTDSYQIKDGGHYFIIGDICGKPGETVNVPVYIFGDTGTAGIQTFFGYDKALTLNKFNMPNENYAYRISAQRNTAVYPATYVLATDQNMTAKDGSVLTLLNFTIPENAKEGTCYDICFMDDPDSPRMVVDHDSNPLNVKYYNGSITVLSDGKTALNRTSVSFSETGETANLTLFNAVGEVKWSSSDPNVATVDENGFVTAVGPGAATITAECGGKTYTASVSSMMIPGTHEGGMRGDLDGDGEITSGDAQGVLMAYTEELASGASPLTEAQISACDIDGDGSITAADAQYILLYFTENTVTGNPTTWEDLVK